MLALMMGFCHLNIHKCLNFSILGMVKILVNTGKLKLVIFLINHRKMCESRTT